MIRVKQVMAIARAEGRITRRLARYWIFLALAYLVGIFFFVQYSVIHGLFSSFSATVAMITPRFLLSIIGMYYMAIFLVGTVFLAFEIRARDIRERMIEVLDSRPYSNLELVVGRYAGIFLVSWLPIVILAVFFLILGLVLTGLGLPVGEPIDVYSMISLVFLMAVPALSFSIAMIFFVTLLVRNRLFAAIVLVALTGLIYWSMVWLPSIYGNLFDIFGLGAAFFSSEIVCRLATPEGWIQRGSVLLAAFAVLGFSAAVHPRPDGGSRKKLALESAFVLIIAIFMSLVVFYKNSTDQKITETWKNAHIAATNEMVPDIKKIAGNVSISPGRDLLLDIYMTFEAPEGVEIQKALFTLNPGQEIKGVSDSTGNPMAFTHENGLLEITLPEALMANEEKIVHLDIQGKPDSRFAYLFSAFNTVDLSGRSSQNLPLLGLIPGVFDRAFVALLPGIRWLPASGPEKGRDDPRVRSVDYFHVDLKVDLPEGWLAAGPGRRDKVEENNGRAVFRFSPSAPVPDAAVIASRFESRSMEVEGVNLEILINKKHTKNLDVLSDTKEKIREWAEDRLREAKEYGLSYPYEALTLVEIPNFLRIYGGGWRMDTIMAPPGILLMKESGFPTARFDSFFLRDETYKDKEGGIVQAKWDRLKSFFVNDLSGGNIFSGSARNFFIYQTSAEGPEGLALNYVMETLSNLLITENKSYFSAHQYVNGGLGGDSLNMAANQVINTVLNSFFTNPSTQVNIVDNVTRNMTSRPEVWDSALGVALDSMDPWKDPALTIDVLTLKATAVAQAILDTLGREKTGELLALIRESRKGESFSIDDVLKAGNSLGYDLRVLLGDWLGSTDLPGFICEKSKIYRISDSEDGNPRYQMLFTIRNDEPAPGFFRIVYYVTGEGNRQEGVKSDPIHMEGRSAIQYGIIVSTPPAYAVLEPYLSLNRESVYLPLNTADVTKIENTDAVEGLEDLIYSVPQEDFIEVDDLDPGFSVIEEKKSRGLRILARKKSNVSTDQGLPITNANAFRLPSTWSRATNIGSFGRYRHTLAVVGAGEGEKKAVFTAFINRAGKWDLSLFIPWKNNIFLNKKWGTYHLVVTDANGDRREISIDSKAAAPGWNLTEGLDLPEGETTVAVSNRTDGDFIVADAIRWSPSAAN